MTKGFDTGAFIQEHLNSELLASGKLHKFAPKFNELFVATVATIVVMNELLDSNHAKTMSPATFKFLARTLDACCDVFKDLYYNPRMDGKFKGQIVIDQDSGYISPDGQLEKFSDEQAEKAHQLIIAAKRVSESVRDARSLFLNKDINPSSALSGLKTAYATMARAASVHYQ